MRKLLGVASLLVVASCSDQHLVEPAGDSAIAAAAVSDGPAGSRIVQGEYLVLFKTTERDPDLAAREVARRTPNGTVLAIWKPLHGAWLRLPGAAIEHVRANPRVAYVEPNRVGYLTTTACGAVTCQTIGWQYDNWGLDRIDQLDNPLDGYFAYNANGTGVHIWIFDKGVDTTGIAEIESRVDRTSYWSYDGASPFEPCHTHGNNVAIMAAGFVHGVAKGATINVARISNTCDNTVDFGAATSAYVWVADHAARPAVINQSSSGSASTVLEMAVRLAVSSGITVVVSAGNDGANACDYTPARESQAITVGATDMWDYRVVRWNEQGWASNYGSCLDLFAPGYNVISGYPSATSTFGGTSAAAPMTAGVAALYLQDQPSATPATVAQWIAGNASPGTLLNIGSGSPNRMLHSRSAAAAPTVTSAVTNPNPARQYTPFTLTITGSGFNPQFAEIVITPAGCGTNYDTGTCVSIISNGSLTTKTPTQLVAQNLVWSMSGVKDVYVRNGRNGYLSLPARQITVNPMY